MDKLILTLMSIPGIGIETARRLIADINEEEAENTDFIEGLMRRICSERKADMPGENMMMKAMDNARWIIEKSLRNNISFVNITSKDYPQRLRSIQKPPLILFYKGNIKAAAGEKSIAIVGTRTPSFHGMRVSRRLGNIFARKGYTVISGLAAGCDSYAHIGCIESCGNTIAVMPCPLDEVCPQSNSRLFWEILNHNGCTISEYPVGNHIYKGNFIKRDRIESGLSDGVIIVETGIKGGTMHTADYSIRQGRPLACYLGTNTMAGNKSLINEGKAYKISNSIELGEFTDILDSRGVVQPKITSCLL